MTTSTVWPPTATATRSDVVCRAVPDRCRWGHAPRTGAPVSVDHDEPVSLVGRDVDDAKPVAACLNLEMWPHDPVDHGERAQEWE